MENRKPQRRPVRKYEKPQDRNTGRSKPGGRPVRKYGKKREDDQDDRKNQGSSEKRYENKPERGSYTRKPESGTGRKYERTDRDRGRSDSRPVRKYERKSEENKGERKYRGVDNKFENNQDRFNKLGKQDSAPDRKYEKPRERNFGTGSPEDKPVRKYRKNENDRDDRKYKGRSERSESSPPHYHEKKPTARPVRKYEKPQDAIRKPGSRQDSKVSKKPGIKKVVSQIRLNRFIANSGLCSRRDADEHIKSGNITVNGKQVTDLGTKVSYDDDVRFKNKRLSSEKKVYILMNKPKDYVTTVEDPHAEHTVLDLLGDDFPERVYPVGRLDKATTGVLILTNDGELTGKLTHPKFKRKKIYHVFLDKPVTKNDLFKLTEGVDLEGTMVAADAVSYADEDDKSQIGIELHSGQNRVIRRMFETLGYKVKKLDRVYFAGLTKKNVQRGKWRFLTDKEVSMLKRGIF